MLLFDANISPNLLENLSPIFPNCQHVFSVGLEKNDFQIREYARDNNLAIISKDQDFYHYYLQIGFPPKVIWIKRGNCKTRDIFHMLVMNKEIILEFLDNKEVGLLILK